jgi:hypothetical protein
MGNRLQIKPVWEDHQHTRKEKTPGVVLLAGYDDSLSMYNVACRLEDTHDDARNFVHFKCTSFTVRYRHSLVLWARNAV